MESENPPNPAASPTLSGALLERAQTKESQFMEEAKPLIEEKSEAVKKEIGGKIHEAFLHYQKLLGKIEAARQAGSKADLNLSSEMAEQTLDTELREIRQEMAKNLLN